MRDIALLEQMAAHHFGAACLVEHVVGQNDRGRGIQASVYVSGMSDGTLARSYGKVFNEVAVEYDRNRPAYPDALVDQACEVADIRDGARVLEIGCGTGQLTHSLLARGLRVTALEPGDQLIRVAEENLKDAGDVEFVHARLEDMQLPCESYEAVFSASAIHWVDPDLSWRKIADALAPNGTLALIQYFGLQEQRSVDDQKALLSALRRHAREIAATWPIYRDLDCTIAGVRERRRNVADAWGWLGSYDIGRDYAADLFEDLQLATVPALIEHTAGELNALLGTMSFWARLSPDQRDALVNENYALHERLGRPIRASTVAALVTARRSAPAPHRVTLPDGVAQFITVQESPLHALPEQRPDGTVFPGAADTDCVDAHGGLGPEWDTRGPNVPTPGAWLFAERNLYVDWIETRTSHP